MKRFTAAAVLSLLPLSAAVAPAQAWPTSVPDCTNTVTRTHIVRPSGFTLRHTLRTVTVTRCNGQVFAVRVTARHWITGR